MFEYGVFFFFFKITFRFFSENIPKYVENHLLRDPETIKKKYQNSFQDMGTEKKKDRPVHHLSFLPSVNIKNEQIPHVN